jgi:hypothetical protein
VGEKRAKSRKGVSCRRQQTAARVVCEKGPVQRASGISKVFSSRDQAHVINHVTCVTQYYMAPYYYPTKDAADQLRASKDKVLTETLPARSLGLSQTPRPVLDGLSDFLPSLLPLFDIQLTFSPSAVPVLHPSILVLTKLGLCMCNGRWVYSTENQGEERRGCG